MLRLTQELFGPEDSEMRREADHGDLHNVVLDFFDYFNRMTADRRANPRDDLATLIANAEVDGKPIGEFEAMSYYVIVATAGHDTTSSSAAGGLLALIENPSEMAKLKADPDLIPSAVEEMIRWVTPVKHFMRTATADCIVGGKSVRAGEALTLFYPSGNRDEAVFDDPFTFRVDRAPNRQIAFGFGAHLCLGMHLARMEMAELFRELLPRLEHIELAGEPSRVASSFVSGLKHLPVRYRLRA
jgi:cytochrome P450